MQYQGGKSRISKSIVEVIKKHFPNTKEIWEPFCGGGAVTLELAKSGYVVHASDNHEDLILMWQALMRGETTPFTDVTEDEYRMLKSASSSARRGFVGFGASFGGGWWAGYGRRITRKAQPYQESYRSIHRLLPYNIFFTLSDYQTIPGDVLAYADPPYYGTKPYQGKQFDHLAFWEWVLNRSGPTFVSELIGPDCLEVVWKKEHKSQNASNSPVTKHTSSIITREEKLFYCPGKVKI